MNALERLGQIGVVPVVKIERAADAPKLAEALLQGGLPCAEITFRTAAAEEAIRLISKCQPDLTVGAGTVLSLDHAQRAAEAGACFVVSPGFDPKVVDWCIQQHLTVIPGVATPTEALMGMDRGLHVLKFFPSESLGGIAMLEAISAALIGIKFVPTGGVSPANMATYLRCASVYAVAGTWLATAKLISSGSFADIARLASEAVEIVRSVRGKGAAA